jgi:hypothetical protein
MGCSPRNLVNYVGIPEIYAPNVFKDCAKSTVSVHLSHLAACSKRTAQFSRFEEIRSEEFQRKGDGDD